MYPRPEEDLGCIREQGEALSLLLPHPQFPFPSHSISALPHLSFRQASRPLGFFGRGERGRSNTLPQLAAKLSLSPNAPHAFLHLPPIFALSNCVCIMNGQAGGKAGACQLSRGRAQVTNVKIGVRPALSTLPHPKMDRRGGDIYPAIVPLTNSAN